MQRDSLSSVGVFTRFIIALALVYGTYNPEGVSYFHWAIYPLMGGPPTSGLLPLKFLVGLLIAAGWAVYLNATRRSLGLPGALLFVAIIGGVIWLLVDLDVVHVSSSRGIQHAILFALAILLSAGMSWSFMSRRLSGQIDTDITQ